MKIQIDTNSKTINIQGAVNLKECVDQIQKMLPNDWQEYRLETDVITCNWNYPYYMYPFSGYSTLANGLLNS